MKLTIEIEGPLAQCIADMSRAAAGPDDTGPTDASLRGTLAGMLGYAAEQLSRGGLVPGVRVPGRAEMALGVTAAAVAPELASSALVMVNDGEPWFGKVLRMFWENGKWMADVAATWVDQPWGIEVVDDVATWEVVDLVPLTEAQASRWLGAKHIDEVEADLVAQIRAKRSLI